MNKRSLQARGVDLSSRQAVEDAIDSAKQDRDLTWEEAAKRVIRKSQNGGAASRTISWTKKLPLAAIGNQLPPRMKTGVCEARKSGHFGPRALGSGVCEARKSGHFGPRALGSLPLLHRCDLYRLTLVREGAGVIKGSPVAITTATS
jgi:hypothetical protein